MITEADQIARFRQVIASRAGLTFPDDHQRRLSDILCRRLAELKCAAGTYLDRLEASATQDDRREWMLLADEVTVGETYFFRHDSQFEAFRERVVPAMMRLPGTRTATPGCALRWMCSSGEEAFSLAMALEECGQLLSLRSRARSRRSTSMRQRSRWRARSGAYPAWSSLRETSQERRARNFTASGQRFQLAERILAQVRFEVRNLMADDPLFWKAGSFEAIFCRNVLMYLHPEAAREVVNRLRNALVPGGYLFLGHAETLRGMCDAFEICNSHDTFYYQLRSGHRCAPAPSPLASRQSGSATMRSVMDEMVELPTAWVGAIGRSALRVASLADVAGGATGEPHPPASRPMTGMPSSPTDVAGLAALVSQERFSEALAGLRALLPAQQQEPLPALLLPLALIQLGEVEQAQACCDSRLSTAPHDIRCLYIRGLCYEQSGDLTNASADYELARRRDPAFAFAHLRHGLLLRRAGRHRTARCEAFAQARDRLASEDALHLSVVRRGLHPASHRRPLRIAYRWRCHVSDEYMRPQRQDRGMRRAFDDTFANAPVMASQSLAALLLVKAGGQAHAIALKDLLSIEPVPALVPLPAQHPAFVGLAGADGRPLAVFSLAQLMGLARDERSRWMLIVPGQVGIAVASIIGHLQARTEDLREDRAGQVRPAVKHGVSWHQLIDLTALLRPVLARTRQHPTTPKE